MEMNRAFRIVRDAAELLEKVARDCDELASEARDAADDLDHVRRFLQTLR